jgi:hypothetical protein
MYPRSTEHAVLKLLLGSGVPRVMNRAVADDQAVRELKDAGLPAGPAPSSGGWWGS